MDIIYRFIPLRESLLVRKRNGLEVHPERIEILRGQRTE
jgi:hypothetical protein